METIKMVFDWIDNEESFEFKMVKLLGTGFLASLGLFLLTVSFNLLTTKIVEIIALLTNVCARVIGG